MVVRKGIQLHITSPSTHSTVLSSTNCERYVTAANVPVIMSLMASEIRQDLNRGRSFLRTLKMIVARFPITAIATRTMVKIRKMIRWDWVSFSRE